MKSSEPKRWRVIGVSDDGTKVTLGRYETKEEAERDHSRIVNDGFYKSVDITPIEVKEEPEQDAAGAKRTGSKKD
jgi:hypothetical protein